MALATVFYYNTAYCLATQTKYIRFFLLCQGAGPRLLKNKLGSQDLGWLLGVVIPEHSHLQGGYSHGQGALQEAADWFVLWGLGL